jgi:formylglycine-generating enzyme required for sulfatase activity
MKKTVLFLSLLCSQWVGAQQRGAYVVWDNGASIAPPPQEKRYALVIGNNAYQYIGKLRNAVSDATLMTSTLRSVGFEVETVTNGTRSEMVAALRRLGKKAAGQHTVALFYYSGHGLQVRDENWLVPVDALADSPADVANACVGLSSVTIQLEQANTGTNLVVLDACRNNPFPYGRNAGGGLTAPKNVPSGTYIAFSTAPNTTAADGSGSNSPYTLALSKAMQMPNLEIEKAFKWIRVEVKATGQTPWENSSLEGEFYFKPVQVAPVAPTVQPTPKDEPTVQPTPKYEPPAPRVEPAPTPSVAKRDFTETATGASFAMKYVSGNTFQMGSTDAYAGDDEKPVHTVRVGDFHMGQYEVTVGEYLKFCEATNGNWPMWLEKWSSYHIETGSDKHYFDKGYRRIGSENLPIVGVSWDNAVAYCKWLSSTTGKTYRLPTEAEWEYAARGGQSYRYSGNNDANQVGWNNSNSGGKPHPVGQKSANGYGLHDMSGNVLEWCSDWYDEKFYSNIAATAANPTNTATGTFRVVRGGNWQQHAVYGCIEDRDYSCEACRLSTQGFRVVAFP